VRSRQWRSPASLWRRRGGPLPRWLGYVAAPPAKRIAASERLISVD
jgi:hypothetical protein